MTPFITEWEDRTKSWSRKKGGCVERGLWGNGRDWRDMEELGGALTRRRFFHNPLSTLDPKP